jgi:catalase
LQEWLAQHPTSMAAVEYVGRLGIDVSYGGVSYYGVHAFEFEGPSGSTFARFSWVPDTAVPPLPRGTDMTGKPRDRLRREMTERARTGRSPGFSLVAQVQGPGDATDDPTVLWTSTDRRTLGHLQLGGLVEDQYWGCEALHFNPTRLIDGINQSPDPILAARARAYDVSAERRCAAYPVPARMPSPSHGV